MDKLQLRRFTHYKTNATKINLQLFLQYKVLRRYIETAGISAVQKPRG